MIVIVRRISWIWTSTNSSDGEIKEPALNEYSGSNVPGSVLSRLTWKISKLGHPTQIVQPLSIILQLPLPAFWIRICTGTYVSQMRHLPYPILNGEIKRGK